MVSPETVPGNSTVRQFLTWLQQFSLGRAFKMRALITATTCLAIIGSPTLTAPSVQLKLKPTS